MISIALGNPSSLASSRRLESASFPGEPTSRRSQSQGEYSSQHTVGETSMPIMNGIETGHILEHIRQQEINISNDQAVRDLLVSELAETRSHNEQLIIQINALVNVLHNQEVQFKLGSKGVFCLVLLVVSLFSSGFLAGYGFSPSNGAQR
ncbi:MAG: hypothetical protein O3A77_02125 [bacterium]|nr:hypothetical protein [bacterium]